MLALVDLLYAECSGVLLCCFFSSRRRHTRCALATGVQRCALPIYIALNFKRDQRFAQRGAANAQLHSQLALGGQARFGCKFTGQDQLAQLLADLTIKTLGFDDFDRSEEHTSELQSLMRISYAVFCLKKKINKHSLTHTITTHIY